MKCPACEGTGSSSASEARVPDLYDCQTCSGTGDAPADDGPPEDDTPAPVFGRTWTFEPGQVESDGDPIAPDAWRLNLGPFSLVSMGGTGWWFEDNTNPCDLAGWLRDAHRAIGALLPPGDAEVEYLRAELDRVTADTTSSKPYRQRYRETSSALARANYQLAAALGRVRELETNLEETRRLALAQVERVRALQGELEEAEAQPKGDPVAGKEAEELRSGLEALIALGADVGLSELQRLLDGIDARDSLAYLESKP